MSQQCVGAMFAVVRGRDVAAARGRDLRGNSWAESRAAVTSYLAEQKFQPYLR
jgi:hypothetical protein